MSRLELQATFSGEGAAQEASRKLLALRATEVSGWNDNGTVTATIDASVAERALHLINQIDENANTTIN